MKKKKKTVILRWSALLAAFLMVIIVVLFDSSEKIMQQAEIMVKNSTIQMIGKYSERISSKFHSIQVDGVLLANLIEKGNMTTPQQLQQYLEILCEEEGIIEAVYMEKGTVVADRSGKTTDLTQKVYYEKVMELEEVTVVCIEDEEIAEGKVFLFVIPVAGQEGKIFFYYPAVGLKELINMSAETYRPTASAMVNEDGSIFVCSDEKNPFFAGGNIWKNISGKSKSEISTVQYKMRARSSGRSNLSAGDVEGVIFYAPVGEGTWGLIAEYDQDSITRQERQIWYDACQMVFRVTGIMVLLLLIYIVVNIIRRILRKDNKALEEKADTDQLTGLSNKIATERKIKEYISMHPKDLALMFVLDIDNFKKINDTMGHAFGDEVLRTLGNHIGVNFRVTDIIGRTGGDEFTIFLKSLKDDSNTLREAQKIVAFFRGFQVGEYVKYSVTASIGAAVFPQDGKNFETLYKAADQALYKAKNRGKNQLAFYDDRDRK